MVPSVEVSPELRIDLVQPHVRLIEAMLGGMGPHPGESIGPVRDGVADLVKKNPVRMRPGDTPLDFPLPEGRIVVRDGRSIRDTISPPDAHPL